MLRQDAAIEAGARKMPEFDWTRKTLYAPSDDGIAKCCSSKSRKAGKAGLSFSLSHTRNSCANIGGPANSRSTAPSK